MKETFKWADRSLKNLQRGTTEELRIMAGEEESNLNKFQLINKLRDKRLQEVKRIKKEIPHQWRDFIEIH